MKLPSLPFFKKDEPKEYYLALLFQDEQVQAVIFEESNKVLYPVNTATTLLMGSIERLNFERLLTTLDKVISTAENALPGNIQTHKTIFGLQQSWIEGGQIKKEYLLTLKKACEELDLQPVGFLVFPEAIAHLLQEEEGAPVSGILVEIGSTAITATLLRAGRVVESRIGQLNDDNIPKSIDSLLAFFENVEILPSRIILADEKNRTQLVQELVHHKWSKQLPFLHVPQVTPLKKNFAIEAILHGTATQMGLTAGTPPHPRPSASFQDQFASAPTEQHTPIQDKNPQPEQLETTQEPLKEPLLEYAEKEEDESHTAPEDGDNFGFVRNTDVAEHIDHPKAFRSNLQDNAFGETEEELADETFANIPEDVKEGEEGFGTRAGGLGTSGVLTTQGFKKTLHALIIQMKKGNLSLGSILMLFRKIPHILLSLLKGPKLILAVPAILLLILASILWYIFGLHAQAILVMNPQHINAKQSITLTTSNATNLDSNTLGGIAVSVDESGSTTADATGTKETGDKAKGTVTLYNNNAKSVTLDAGTTITSSNNLKFTLDKDVTIASSSGDEFSGTKPGTTNASVTASTFGTDYNLPSGTKFTTSTSGVVAKNDNAFSGGTKKSLTVIAASDITNAQNDLINKLEDKAKQDMQKQNGADKTVLPLFTSTAISTKSTDKNTGDQADSVTLTATVTYQSIAYTSKDLKDLAQNLLKNQIPSDMTPADGGVTATLQDVSASKDGASAKATLQASAGLLPILDKKQIAQKIAGKSVSQIQETLSDIKQLESVSMQLSPNLFFLPRKLPIIASHIDVQITQ